MFLHADSEDCDLTGRKGNFVGFVMTWLIFAICFREALTWDQWGCLTSQVC